ncbi:MAG: YaaC family protein [Pseudomonadales bacterium]
MQPNFASKTVLVTDTWDYVAMWLKRNKKGGDAYFYWQQAKSFFDASSSLPKESSPLTSYYCFLNATKAFLAAHGRHIPNMHGAKGWSVGKAALSNEKVRFYQDGVLSELCRALGETSNGDEYTLGALLYNLPYIHRAYSLTYTSAPELFTPISRPHYVRKSGSTEGWFSAVVTDTRYATGHTTNKLPITFERDEAKANFVIRRRSRFKWEQGKSKKEANLRRLRSYHRNVRKHVAYIHGPQTLWYIKRRDNVRDFIPRCPLTLTFAAMHRLSELCRYTPTRLARHFECGHNWLLSEFIATAPQQFMDEISSAITGQDFMIPGRRASGA